MRAAFLTGTRALEVRGTELPAVGDGQVMVRVVGCGICGSDLHGWNHPELTIVAGDGPLPGFSGHEIVAEPIDAPGALVAIEPNRLTACGACEVCEEGAAWFCRDRTAISSFGFAEQLIVPADSMFRLPGSVQPATATLVEPLACAIHTFRFSSTARLTGRLDGIRVAVLGSGVTGLLSIAAAVHLGASEVVATARHPHQAAAARRMGAADVLVAGGDETEKKLRAFHPEFVVEAVGGAADTLGLAMKAAAPRSEIAVFGLFDEPQSLDARRATYKELRFFFPVTYSVLDGVHDFEIAIDMLANSDLDFDSLITHTFPLSRVDEAFRTAANKQSGALRVVVEP